MTLAAAESLYLKAPEVNRAQRVFGVSQMVTGNGIQINHSARNEHRKVAFHMQMFAT